MEGLIILRRDRVALTTHDRVLDCQECVVRIPEGATNIETFGDPITRAPKMVKYTYEGCRYWDNGISGPIRSVTEILGILTNPEDYLYN